MPPNSPGTSLNTDWKCVCILRVLEWKITDLSRGTCTAKLWNIFICNIVRVEGCIKALLSPKKWGDKLLLYSYNTHINKGDWLHLKTVYVEKRKLQPNHLLSRHTHTAVFNKMPHPICIYTGTEQGWTHRTGFAPGGKEEVNTYMTLQKHKPVQHKSQLTHCQNTLRQIAKNNLSLCQPHTRIHTQTLRVSSARLQKTEAGQILWCKNRGKKKISERRKKRNKERVIHPIVSFHNPHSFSSPVFCFSAQTTS